MQQGLAFFPGKPASLQLRQRVGPRRGRRWLGILALPGCQLNCDPLEETIGRQRAGTGSRLAGFRTRWMNAGDTGAGEKIPW